MNSEKLVINGVTYVPEKPPAPEVKRPRELYLDEDTFNHFFKFKDGTKLTSEKIYASVGIEAYFHKGKFIKVTEIPKGFRLISREMLKKVWDQSAKDWSKMYSHVTPQFTEFCKALGFSEDER